MPADLKAQLAEIEAMLAELKRCDSARAGRTHYLDSGPYCGGCQDRRWELVEKLPRLLTELTAVYSVIDHIAENVIVSVVMGENGYLGTTWGCGICQGEMFRTPEISYAHKDWCPRGKQRW